MHTSFGNHQVFGACKIDLHLISINREDCFSHPTLQKFIFSFGICVEESNSVKLFAMHGYVCLLRWLFYLALCGLAFGNGSVAFPEAVDCSTSQVYLQHSEYVFLLFSFSLCSVSTRLLCLIIPRMSFARLAKCLNAQC